MELTNIIKGHLNELFKRQEEMSEERLKICRECPLYRHTAIGYICDDDLWLNPDTNETFKEKTEGAYQGCHCRLAAKTTIKDAHCPAKKW